MRAILDPASAELGACSGPLRGHPLVTFREGGCIALRDLAESLGLTYLQILDYLGAKLRRKAASTISTSDWESSSKPVCRLSAGGGAEQCSDRLTALEPFCHPRSSLSNGARASSIAAAIRSSSHLDICVPSFHCSTAMS